MHLLEPPQLALGQVANLFEIAYLVLHVLLELYGLAFRLAARRAFRLAHELLVAVLDLGLLDLEFMLNLLQSLRARLLAHLGDHVRGEIHDLLQILQGKIQHEAEARGHAAQKPNVRHGHGQTDMTHALASHLRARDLHAALVTDNAFVTDALVFAAVALPVLHRAENFLVKKTVFLRPLGAVIDGFRLGHFSVGPLQNLGRGSQPNLHCFEFGSFLKHHFFSSSGETSSRISPAGSCVGSSGSEPTRLTSRQRDCSSFTKTRKDSGTFGVRIGSPLTMDS